MSFDSFARSAREGLFPKLQDSAACIQIVGKEPLTAADLDVKQCLELGAMIMLNKPILVVAAPGYTVPPGIRRVADAIVEGIDITTAAGQEAVQRELTKLIHGLNNEV